MAAAHATKMPAAAQAGTFQMSAVDHTRAAAGVGRPMNRSRSASAANAREANDDGEGIEKRRSPPDGCGHAVRRWRDQADHHDRHRPEDDRVDQVVRVGADAGLPRGSREAPCEASVERVGQRRDGDERARHAPGRRRPRWRQRLPGPPRARDTSGRCSRAGRGMAHASLRPPSRLCHPRRPGRASGRARGSCDRRPSGHPAAPMRAPRAARTIAGARGGSSRTTPAG